jgi:alkylation response protein AidB-like acyl-CoA dehydrogenase
MEVTLWQAAWRLDARLPSEREVAIARYTAAEGAHRVLATAQHLHGGMGFDKDYALHRYFLAVKAWEFVGGGASAQLERLGSALARG